MPWIRAFDCFYCGHPVSVMDRGAGYSWTLLICDHCDQDYILKNVDGFYPKEVWDCPEPIDLSAKIRIKFKS